MDIFPVGEHNRCMSIHQAVVFFQGRLQLYRDQLAGVCLFADSRRNHVISGKIPTLTLYQKQSSILFLCNGHDDYLLLLWRIRGESVYLLSILGDDPANYNTPAHRIWCRCTRPVHVVDMHGFNLGKKARQPVVEHL